MEISLTPEQTDVVNLAVEQGRVHDSEEAVRQAIAIWVDRERRRIELVSSLDEAEAAVARGEGIEITGESMGALGRDVMARCARRLDSGGT